MNMLVQNVLVFLLIGGCMSYVGYQAIQAVRGRKSKLGSCCAKGCDAGGKKTDGVPKAAPEQFIPLAALSRRAHK